VLNRSERTYNSYLLLLQLVPRLKETLEDDTVDSKMFNQFITHAGFLVLFIDNVLLIVLLVLYSFRGVPMTDGVMTLGA
jgi:hypothetical protein